LLSVVVSFGASFAMLAVSALNYPGGEALAYLKENVLLSTAADNIGGGGRETVVVPVHADVLACMTGVTLFGSSLGTTADAAAAAVLVPGLGGALGGGAAGKTGTGASETVMVRQQRGGHGNGNGVRIVVDKTEDAAILASADFWGQFDYVLVEDPSKVLGGAWEAVGVVKGYGGIEVVRPGAEDGDGENGDAPRVVGLGRTVALWKRRVRAVTGGWWVGPRMVEKIYILKKVRGQDAARTRVAVEAK
jgi:alpha-1,6-mannosyltransferase